MPQVSHTRTSAFLLPSPPQPRVDPASHTAACSAGRSVFWFNDVMVTTDIPPPEDLETVLETGSWAWNWMEPPLGQLSFFLLCVQFIPLRTPCIIPTARPAACVLHMGLVSVLLC